jgi:hypothetical protein
LRKDHPDYALAAMNLGIGYNKQKNYSMALDFLYQSLDINEKHFGPNNPKTAAVLFNIGASYN